MFVLYYEGVDISYKILNDKDVEYHGKDGVNLAVRTYGGKHIKRNLTRVVCVKVNFII